jgi:porphobilinogen synthase
MVRETRLTGDALIYPLFIVPGRGVRRAVVSMPGICQLSVDEAVQEAKRVMEAGVLALMVFAAPTEKDAKASAALDPHGLVPEAIAAIKRAHPRLLVWADVCLCGATDHGHCGHVLPSGEVDNDSSVETLAKVALNYARAGADLIITYYAPDVCRWLSE